jgi:hypothetical protein
MLAHQSIRQPVSTSGDTFEGACKNKATQRLRMNTGFGRFAPSDRAAPTGKAQ